MDVSVNVEDRGLIFTLFGELDSHNFGGIKQIMDSSINRYIFDRVIFDFSNLTFMDSTGIGMLIGRYKLLKRYKKPCYILGGNGNILKILKMSGIFDIIKHIDKREDVV